MVTHSGMLSLVISISIYIVIGPIFFFVFMINEFTRLVVGIYLYLKYNGKVSLVQDGVDALWALKRPGFTRMILMGLRVKHKIKEETMLEWLNKVVNYEDATGTRVYERLTYLFTIKCGYACWKRDHFDIKNHCRFLSSHSVYTESDVKILLQKLNQDMDETRPQWEFVIVPRYKETGDTEETTLILTRFQHCYMDGLCVVMILRNVMTSNFTYYLNPCEFKVPRWKKALYYTNALLHGPYTVLDLAVKLYNPKWILLQSSRDEVIERNYAWTNQIEMDTIKTIKQATNDCTISAVIVNAFISAALQVLPKKRIPENCTIGEMAAMLPYPDQNLRNRFSCYLYDINSNDEDFLRMTKAKKDSKEAMLGPTIPTTFATLKLFGRLPVALHNLCISGAATSLVCSNVPFSRTKTLLLGTNELLEVHAYPPQPNETGITILVIAYQNKLKICASAASNWLRKDELEVILKKMPTILQNWCTTSVNMSQL